MTHLMTLSIGPVQDFIAAARRTRDLWFGSHVLSELSKAAARAVAEIVGLENLVFPAPENMKALEKDGDLNVANVLLFLVPGKCNHLPTAIREAAHAAATARWKEFGETARSEFAHLSNENIIDDERWDSQMDDVIELFAAWLPLPSNDQYRETRQSLMRLMAGRKSLRDFRQEPIDGTGIPKSSLDGARDCVFNTKLRRNTAATSSAVAIPFLQTGERLDAVGLTKRFGGGVRPFPSIPRIAADPWLRRAEKKKPAEFATFRGLCGELGLIRGDTFARVFPQYGAFPHEGFFVFPSRDEAWEEEGVSPEKAERHKKDLRDTRKQLIDDKAIGDPFPYAAILVADGDRMGAALGEIKSPEDHRRFSQALSGFAAAAADIVKENQGALVYSGGDDVLAFLPCDTAVKCAERLKEQFHEMLNPVSPNPEAVPTLSVGIAIGHAMVPLEDLLDYARAAEKAAKNNGRNSLAVHLHTRGGAPVRIVGRWEEPNEATPIHMRLKQWQTLLKEKKIPSGAAYEMRQLVALYKTWTDKTAAAEALLKDLLRMFRRKETPGDAPIAEADLKTIAAWLRPDVTAASEAPDTSDPAPPSDFAARAESLANEYIVARKLALLGD